MISPPRPSLFSGWCKTWTLDSGLDSWTGLWTEIWTRFWTDAQGNDDHFQETMDEGMVLQLQARLVTSNLVRTFPGPSGYEVKSQGASLEATCKHGLFHLIGIHPQVIITS